jgi:hypothetical protein
MSTTHTYTQAMPSLTMASTIRIQNLQTNPQTNPQNESKIPIEPDTMPETNSTTNPKETSTASKLKGKTTKLLASKIGVAIRYLSQSGYLPNKIPAMIEKMYGVKIDGEHVLKALGIM